MLLINIVKRNEVLFLMIDIELADIFEFIVIVFEYSLRLIVMVRSIVVFLLRSIVVFLLRSVVLPRYIVFRIVSRMCRGLFVIQFLLQNVFYLLFLFEVLLIKRVGSMLLGRMLFMSRHYSS